MMSGGQFRTLTMFFSVAGEHFLLETENTAEEAGKFKSFLLLRGTKPPVAWYRCYLERFARLSIMLV